MTIVSGSMARRRSSERGEAVEESRPTSCRVPALQREVVRVMNDVHDDEADDYHVYVGGGDPLHLSVSGNEMSSRGESISLSDLSLRSETLARHATLNEPEEMDVNAAAVLPSRASTASMMDQPLTHNTADEVRFCPCDNNNRRLQTRVSSARGASVQPSSSSPATATNNNNAVLGRRGFTTASPQTASTTTTTTTTSAAPTRRSRVQAMSTLTSLRTPSRLSILTEESGLVAQRTLTEEWSAFMQSESSDEWIAMEDERYALPRQASTGRLRSGVTGRQRINSFRVPSQSNNSSHHHHHHRVKSAADLEFITPMTSDLQQYLVPVLELDPVLTDPLSNNNNNNGEGAAGVVPRLINSSRTLRRNTAVRLSPLHSPHSNTARTSHVLFTERNPLTDHHTHHAQNNSNNTNNNSSSNMKASSLMPVLLETPSANLLMPTFMSFSKIEAMMLEESVQNATMTFSSQPQSAVTATSTIGGMAPSTATPLHNSSQQRGRCVDDHHGKRVRKMEAPSHLRAMHKELKELGFAMFGAEASTITTDDESSPSLRPTRARVPSHVAVMEHTYSMASLHSSTNI